MKPVKKPLMALFVALFISGVVGATGIKFEKLTLKQGLEKAKKENKFSAFTIFFHFPNL